MFVILKAREYSYILLLLGVIASYASKFCHVIIYGRTVISALSGHEFNFNLDENFINSIDLCSLSKLFKHFNICILMK